jgi:hypothetical protein
MPGFWWVGLHPTISIERGIGLGPGQGWERGPSETRLEKHTFDDISDRSRISEHLQNVLWRLAGIHLEQDERRRVSGGMLATEPAR